MSFTTSLSLAFFGTSFCLILGLEEIVVFVDFFPCVEILGWGNTGGGGWGVGSANGCTECAKGVRGCALLNDLGLGGLVTSADMRASSGEGDLSLSFFASTVSTGFTGSSLFLNTGFITLKYFPNKLILKID